MNEVDENTLIRFLCSRIPGVRALYLFGSVATQQAGADSDLDIAVLAAAPLTALERFELTGELAEKLHRDVDLVVLHDASAVLRIQVIGKGRRLYGRGLEIEAYEDRAFSDYARLNEERSAILADIHERGSVYG